MNADEGPFRILLVEDNDDHATLVRWALDDVGIRAEIDFVADGVEALAYLRRSGAYADRPRPDVVLLDLKLPRLDGHEVLAAAKGDPDLCAIPIVVLSTSQSEADRRRAYLGHANSYLTKPLDHGELTEMLKAFGTYWHRWNARLGSERVDAAS